MKKVNALVLFIFIFFRICFGQINIDFEGSHSLDEWIPSSDSSWEVSDENPLRGIYSLHHAFDNPVSGNDQISFFMDRLVPGNDTTLWRFCIRYGYNPSSINHWGIFLLSDMESKYMTPKGEASGYIAGVNIDSYDDTVKIWKQNDGEVIEILKSTINWQEEIGTEKPVCFEITHCTGQWHLKADTSTNLEGDYILRGSGFDTSNIPGNYFGIYYSYSSSQDRKLWVDDISIDGTFIIDTIPPRVFDVKVIDSNKIVVYFNEPVTDSSMLNRSYYMIRPAGKQPIEVTKAGSETARLLFSEAFQDGEALTLLVHGISDISGNTADTHSISFNYYVPKPFDIIINEIMADPEPRVSLPEAEYIEILNNTHFNIQLEGWQLWIGSDKSIFPEVTIPANDFIVLCRKGEEQSFNQYDNVIGLFTSYIKNRGDLIVLKNTQNKSISFVNYKDTWYGNSVKSEGGWSLERIDPNNPCGGINNWEASTAYEGGTPGMMNSVYKHNPDITPPVVERIAPVNDSSLRLFLSETVDSTTLSKSFHSIITPNPGTIQKAELEPPQFNTLLLSFLNPFSPDVYYSLEIVSTGLSDCVGNMLESEREFVFMLPEPPDSFDVVINEVLFNPEPGCFDFVELYNRSGKAIDLKDLRIASRDDETYEITSSDHIVTTHFQFLPGEYVAITTDKEALLACYDVPYPDRVIETNTLPSLNNDMGRIVIHDKHLLVIDEFAYFENMHFSLLDDNKGVSLERIHYDNPTNDISNWHSSSYSNGWATPGYENAQFNSAEAVEQTISLDYEVFSPDNDGYRDVLAIRYQMNESGYVGTVDVFDVSGRKIRNLLRNELLSKKGVMYWDGLTNEQTRARLGVYIILFKAFHENGDVKKIKKVCVVGGKI